MLTYKQFKNAYNALVKIQYDVDTNVTGAEFIILESAKAVLQIIADRRETEEHS